MSFEAQYSFLNAKEQSLNPHNSHFNALAFLVPVFFLRYATLQKNSIRGGSFGKIF
jgi:hypothetical protein